MKTSQEMDTVDTSLDTLEDDFDEEEEFPDLYQDVPISKTRVVYVVYVRTPTQDESNDDDKNELES